MKSTYVQTNQQVSGCPISRRPPLRVNNVALRLRKPERTVRYLASTKRIRAFKIDGKSWGFWPDDVELYQRLTEASDADRS
jgi:hypothetical protein